MVVFLEKVTADTRYQRLAEDKSSTVFERAGSEITTHCTKSNYDDPPDFPNHSDDIS